MAALKGKQNKIPSKKYEGYRNGDELDVFTQY
jgi:hypothetical protein